MENMRISEISILKLLYNEWNGFTFSILELEIDKLESALFAIYIGDKHLHIDLLFIKIKVIHPLKQ